MGRKSSEYTGCRGDDVLFIGTTKEAAEHFNMKLETIIYYTSPSHISRSSNKRFAGYKIIEGEGNDKQ